MPYTISGRVNRGAYKRPFSGVGIEFYPLGVKPGRSGLTLHEAGYLPDNAQWNYPGVFGSYWRLHYNFQRGHCLLFGEKIVELTPERIVLIPDHQSFHCLGEHPVPSLWITFSFTRQLHPELDVPVVLEPRDTELFLIRDLSNYIESEYDQSGDTDAIYRYSLALLHVVMTRPELRWKTPVPEKLLTVKNNIDRHLSQKMTNAQLAKSIGMGVSGFERLFKRHYGMTVSRYIVETRVSDACDRLMHTNDSIDIIAEETGFANRAYFSRVFKRVTGESPAMFRRKHGSKP